LTLAWCGVALLLVACAGDTPGSSNNNSQLIPCQDESDCPSGWTCTGNVCVQPHQTDGGVDAASQGSINVYPDPVQFGNAPLHADTVREVTVANAGEGDLTVTNIRVLENDDLVEYFANPSGDVQLVIPPAGSEIIQVTLHPEDGELDIAELQVTSDDPVDSVVTVRLTTEYKGDPTLEVCVLSEVADPEPFVDCDLDPGTQTPLLDYGVVGFGTPVSRVVAIRNAADGNAPLLVDGATVTSLTPAIENEFSVRLFEYDTDGVTEIDLTPPLWLSAGDPGQLLEPDVVYAEVTFGANVDGVVDNTQLVIDTNDPGGDDVPISAAVSGCPTDYWDLNGDPADGCEYHCVYQGAEQCASGADDNCNGQQDEEGAQGCVIYYLDNDGDGYGLTADNRCLCAPDLAGNYDAVNAGECDDANNAIHPGAAEVCDGVDNDCDPATTEDFGTTTCGLGICLHTVDNCLSGVPQSCDPLQGQMTEVCDGVDNDCDGDVDEMLQTDVNNCGTCGNTCTNAHGTTACVNGACTPICSGFWEDCSDPDDGCETATNTANDCGGCGIPCSLANASESCNTGSCLITSCDFGWCDADTTASSGCEENLEPAIACPGGAINIGSVNGDNASSSTNYSDFGEKWLVLYVAEANSDPLSCNSLSVRIDLSPPAGTDYDLFVYCDNCTSSQQSSQAGGSASESVTMAWEEDCLFGFPTGSETGRNVYIRVEHWSANTCAPWSLTATGYVSYSSYTCSTL
jgi:hypothetical protein